MPNAQIVADRFHVMKQINEELDAMRKKQKREAEKIKNKGEEALDKIAEWIKSAQKYLPKSCGMIRRWLDEILAYFDKRTSQGIVEGINQKIKLIKRRAYGMTNFDNFQRRILLNWAVS